MPAFLAALIAVTTAFGCGGAASSRCDPYRNTGCPRDEACYVLTPAEGGPLTSSCEPAGTAREAESCAVATDCVGGFLCVDQACAKLCEDNAACSGEARCATRLANEDDSISDYRACAMPAGCNVLDGSGCPSGQTCYLAAVDTCTDTAGTFREGQPCEFANDCAPGHACMNDARVGLVCFRLCDPIELTCGGTSQRCVAFIDVRGVGRCEPLGG